jgi:pimeloyl-ACP methyl ester carboxylesterase
VFLRVSGLLQIAALFTVLAFFFLAPAFDSATPPEYIPSFWFVGLLHAMHGDTSAPMPMLAGHALIALGIVVPLAVLVYVLSWTRNMRRILESPDILPAKNPRIANTLARWITPQPFARAILQFTARTIARSRQHRLMLAIYGGFGLALSIAFARSLFESGHRFSTAWNSPSVPFLLVAGILVLSSAIVGVRTILVFPFAIRSNWIFRITAVHRPLAYFAAVRRALYTTAALPVLALLAIWYLSIWPGRPSIGHVLLLTIFAMVLVERSLYQFRKIPFTCSWLPGGTQRSLKRGIWGMVFLFFVDAVVGIEFWDLGKPARLVLLLGIFGAVAIRSRMRTTEFASDPFSTLQFEESPPSEIFALDLRQDGAWLGEQAYVDAIDPHFGRSFAQRARPFAIGVAVVLLAGFCYEQVWEWKDRREFPQVGHSVDIGGRSLNIYCSGTGSPAVIFDSGSGQPGYSWILVQPQVAAVTRACWYDRAGYGWSDPLWKSRASADIASDLHKLLRAAGVPPPYILVGHSFGGFNVRVYANQYRQEVSGMVLVDSADEFEGPVDALGPEMEEPPLEWRVGARVADFLFHFGLGRLIVDDSNSPSMGRPSRHDSALINSVEFRQKALIATLWENRGRSAAQVQAIRTLGSIPLIVLTAAATQPPPGSATAVGWAEHMRNRVYGTQARLATLSTRGKQIILERSSHDIPFDDPEAIVRAIDEVTRESRVQ